MKLLISLLILGVLLLTGCAEADLDNTTLTIDGKTYKAVEVVPDKTEGETPSPQTTSNIQSVEAGYNQPKNTKYFIIMIDGVIYSISGEYIPLNETIKINNYYVREKDGERWFKHSETKELNRQDIKSIEQVKM